MKGLVVKATGSWYDLKSLEDGSRVTARIRGKIRLSGSRSTNPIVVGDIVEYSVIEKDAVIESIDPRKNYIIRKSTNLSKESHIIAANIDQALVVVSAAMPQTSFEFIDRFLVTAEAYKIPALIVLNKIDLDDEAVVERVALLKEVYDKAGYRVMPVSALENRGIDELKAIIGGKTTLLSGNSGVGKSSLIKRLIPTLDIAIGEVSRSHNKGQHTTTFSQLYELEQGGAIIDTPGIKGFGLIDLDEKELYRYFIDIMHYSPDCKFYNCTHIHEPGCAVVSAIERGDISIQRYESYLKMLDPETKFR